MLLVSCVVCLSNQADFKLATNAPCCLSVYVHQQWNGHRTAYGDGGCPSVLVVTGLKPSSAYVFRLVAADEDGHYGDPGEEHTFHTEGENGDKNEEMSL